MMSPAEALAHAMETDFPPVVPPESRFVLVLDAYFDESGVHSGSRCVSVAGYVSTPDRWKQFDIEWRIAISEWGLEFFHMTDFCVSDAKPYSSWSQEEKMERWLRLVRIINRHAMFSVAWSVATNYYDMVLSQEAKDDLGGPYGLCARICQIEAAKMVKFQCGEPYPWIAYTYAAGAEGAGQVADSFKSLQKRQEDRDYFRAHSLSFRLMKDFTHLQAADILAYEIYRQRQKEDGWDWDLPRRRLFYPLTRIKWSWGHLDTKQLMMWNEALIKKAQRDGKAPRPRIA